ncbi:MAG: MFS transporter [Thermoguttaceae bacterium]
MQPLADPKHTAGGDNANGMDHFNMPFIWGISLVAAMGGLLFGWDFIVVGGAKPFYEKFFHITSENLSGWAVSCAFIGCLIGAMVSGGLSDRFGRKRLLILAGFLFTVSSIGTGMANTLTAYVIWRIIGGVAIGLASNLSPMYIAEVAPASIRGRLVSVNQLTIVIGSLLAQIVNWQVAAQEKFPERAMTPQAVLAKVENLKSHAADFQARKADPQIRETRAADLQAIDERARVLQERYPKLDLSDKSMVAALQKEPDAFYHASDAASNAPDAAKNAVEDLKSLADKAEWWEICDSWNGRIGWRWMFGLTAVPSLLFFLLMFFVPESPRWLAKNGKPAKAQGILGRIGGDAYARRTIDEIEATLVNEVEKVDFRELLEPRMRKVLLIGVVLAVFQQWCGMNVMFYYADRVFGSAGYGINQLMASIVTTGAACLVATIIAIYTVDIVGRRILMLLGAASLMILHFAIATCYYNEIQGIFLKSLIIAIIACYALTLAPVTWVVISEIFPNRIRGAAVSVSVFALWFGCYSVGQSFPFVTKQLGMARAFWIFSAICLAGLVFIWFKLPETKGKSLEQIEKELVD